MSVASKQVPLSVPTTEKRPVNLLVFICTLVYFTSYVTRLNYGAVVSEIIASEGVEKNLASLAVTGLFITYGVGQLISGWLGDRISPKYLMFFGLILATGMNLLLPLSTDPIYMLVVWCVNGFGQALMWPPIVKLLSLYLTPDEYDSATVKISWGSSFGTIAIYLLAPLFISFSGWRSLFWFSAGCGMVGAALSLWGIGSVEKRMTKPGAGLEKAEKADKTEPVGAAPSAKMNIGSLIPLIAFIALAIALQGTLRDGVTTWMPSYIGETFHLGTSISILTGVILPIFSLVCLNASKMIYSKFLHNEMLFSGITFVVAAVAALVLTVLSGFSPIVSVVCSTVIVGCMHAINLMLVCLVPGKFRATGNISTVSGVLNFATYVGAALSTYVFAALSERFGWEATILLWFIVSACGAVVCFALARVWKKFAYNDKK